jgi:glycosyltransferase involved in cell wall biosynthesis
MKLDIAIPTYNRPEPLRKTLGILVPQLRPGVRILVVDNASTYDVDGLVGEFQAARPDAVCLSKNQANIGMGANFCRCFELSTAEWMWLLGDDDEPTTDAVENILSQIDKQEERVVYTCFSTGIGRHRVDMVEDDAERFWEKQVDIVEFANLMFITSGVYRVGVFKKRLQVGCHWAYSCAPHLAMLLLGPSKTEAYASSRRYISNWILRSGPGTWSSFRVSLGLAALAEIEASTPMIHRVLRSNIPVYSPPGLKGPIGLMLRGTDVPVEYWEKYFWRMAGVCGGWGAVRNLLAWFVTRLVRMVPWIRELWTRRPGKGVIVSSRGAERM